MSENKPILQVKDLQVEFASYRGTFSAIRGASYDVRKGEILAIVGESGSGKSVLTQTTLRLTPGKITQGEILFDGKDLASISEKELDKIRGRDISVIFQDAMTALNPTMKIGEQISDVLMKHFVFSKTEIKTYSKQLVESLSEVVTLEDKKTVIYQWLNAYYRPNETQMTAWVAEMTTLLETPNLEAAFADWMMHTGNMTRKRARETAIDLLKLIKIPDPEKRIDQYIFQFSGGMRQRIMVALALACRPKLLIADEPTTALDVTIKAEVLSMIVQLVKELDSPTILITHDLGVVASCADRINVMYAGEFVESGLLDDIFYDPKHPYTKGLLAAIPRLDMDSDLELATIEGAPPSPSNMPSGCPFHPRCKYAMVICQTENPKMTTISKEHTARCWLLDDRATEVRKKCDYEEANNG